MKPKVTSQAKRETYIQNLKNGNIKSKTLLILNFIKGNPNCNTDTIRTSLSTSHQTSTAIISNLLDIGLIKISGETRIKSNTYSNYIFVDDIIEQDYLTKTRESEKFKIWLKQGLNYENNCSSQFYMYLVMENNNLI